jgi:hypothetical protein
MSLAGNRRRLNTDIGERRSKNPSASRPAQLMQRRQRIAARSSRLDEADAVVTQVGGCLGVIPFELHNYGLPVACQVVQPAAF